jgi:hypothetical protein
MDRFLLAEIGKDTDKINEYLQNLPSIDVMYNAPPNPKGISVWRKMAKVKSTISYSDFFDALIDIYIRVSPRIAIIEVLENKDMMFDAVHKMKMYSNIEMLPLTYSAPLRAGKPGMSYCRSENNVIVAANKSLSFDFEYTYSHEFLNGFVTVNSLQNCTGFDPCIGKGLIVRYIKDSYGIEFNVDRLKETIATYKE